MENRTGFNLEDFINNWKNNLSRSHSMTADNVQELESHLLDEIDNLASKGLNEEEAFLIATKRMGTKEHLVTEFSKLNVFNTIVLKCMPFLKGILFYFCLSTLINILGKSSLLSSYYFDMNIVVSNTIFASILFLGLFLVAYKTFNDFKKGKRIFSDLFLLAIMAFILRIMDFISIPLIARYVPMEEFGRSMKNVYAIGYWLVFLILTVAIVFYFKSRQIHKKKIA